MLTGLLLTFALAIPIGCNDGISDEDDGDEVANETGEGDRDEVCKSSCQECEDLSKDAYDSMDAQIVACANSMAASCTGWNPNRRVTVVGTNEWNVERDFIDALVADPSQLVGCDDARVEPSSGFYRVTSLDSDDLLGQLGFVDDDVIQSINGYSMSKPVGVALAFFKLWPDTRVFTVSVLRPGVGELTFTYNLI